MSKRLAAAIAGSLLIVGAIGAYALGKHPVVAGTNKVAALFASLEVPPNTARCQTLVRVPAKAKRVRLIATGVQSPGGPLRVKIGDASGPFDKGVKKEVSPGTLAIRLNRLTRSAHRAQICFVNRGEGRIVLAGERKLITHNPQAKQRTKRLASVIFVRAHKSSWLARRSLIADRFDKSQPGGLGGWALWLALALVASAAGLALWWLVFRLEDRQA